MNPSSFDFSKAAKSGEVLALRIAEILNIPSPMTELELVFRANEPAVIKVSHYREITAGEIAQLEECFSEFVAVEKQASLVNSTD
jgi:hypothetical protein